LQDTYVESLNINTTSGSVTEKSGAAASCVSNDYTFGSVCDANLNFDQAGFRFVDATGNNIGNQVSGVTSGSYFLQAVKSTCTTPGTCTGACVAVFPSGSAVSIDLASECVNPITCQSGQAVTITPGVGAGAAGTIANNNAGAVSASSGSYTTKSLTFNAASPSPAVPFTLNYPDAGQMRLWARYLGSSTISGSSAAFVVAPHHFDLSVGTAAPITAGSNFSTTVTARNSAGAATPNFGKETTAPTVAVASSNPVPALGNATAINTTFSGFSAGAATQNLIWKEVGTIDLGASTTNYLGSGMGVSGSLAGVGRFKPAYFKTQVTQGCAAGAYTYSAQPFTVTTTAYETGGAVTANYAGATWAKAVALTAITAAAGTLGNGAVAATEFAAGVSAHATTTYTFTSPKTAATAPVIRATDTDGVTSAGVPSGEGAVAVRSGRISLRSNYGSELLDLSVPMRAEYWNGSGWSNNDLDVCTSGVTMSLTDVVATDGLVPGETCVQDTANPGLSGLGCAAAGPVSKRFAQPPLAGGFNLWLQAPGPGNTGALNLTANVPAWLKYDWNGTGTAINPTVRETFGLRKTPIIYMRENF
jgi:MSHA biogenesis protein MshQ